MSGHFYIKKFRQQGLSEDNLPLFVVRRSARGKKTKEAYQVRYAGIHKTFPTIKDSLVFTEKILNNQLEDIKNADLIVNSYCDDLKREVVVILKGIDRDDNYVFTESYKQGTPLHFQRETFEVSCCVIWKLYFMKFNSDYRFILLRKNWIGSTRVKPVPNYFQNKTGTKTSTTNKPIQTEQLF